MEKIYCIMITNIKRNKFIDYAIGNFIEQTYPNKTLIVINHSPGTKLINQKYDNIFEFIVNKEQENFSLGELRNIALDGFIPNGALWTTYDDDDIRSIYYLEQLAKRIIYHDLDLLFIKNRLEYNLNNEFKFKSQFKTGMPFFIARKYYGFKYLNVDSLEDIRVGQDYIKDGKKVAKFNNDPRIYIRVIHGNNTSLYVKNDKNSIVEYNPDNNYREFEATQEEINYINNKIEKYKSKVNLNG
jgi:hypothetical protein